MEKKIWIIVALQFVLMWMVSFILKGNVGVLERVLIILILLVIEMILAYRLLYLIRKFKIISMKRRKVSLKWVLCNFAKYEKKCDVDDKLLYQVEIYEYQTKKKNTLIDEIFVDESLIEKLSFINNMFKILIDENDLIYVKNKQGKVVRINSLNGLMDRYLELVCRRKIMNYSFLIANQYNEVKIQVCVKRKSIIKIIYSEKNKSNIESKIQRLCCQ